MPSRRPPPRLGAPPAGRVHWLLTTSVYEPAGNALIWKFPFASVTPEFTTTPPLCSATTCAFETAVPALFLTTPATDPAMFWAVATRTGFIMNAPAPVWTIDSAALKAMTYPYTAPAAAVRLTLTLIPDVPAPSPASIDVALPKPTAPVALGIDSGEVVPLTTTLVFVAADVSSTRRSCWYVPGAID